MLPRSGGYAQKTPPSCKLQSGVICATLPIAKRKMQGVDMIEELIRELEPNWRAALSNFIISNDYQPARESLNAILNVDPVNYYPRGQAILKAFDKTEFNDVRVVIIGRDPYPAENKATGLAFSMPDELRPLSKSIERIYCAIKRDLVEGVIPEHGNLDHWAKQGVLLLNPVLTIREVPGNKNTHRGKGWEKFTKAAVRALSNREKPIQYLLWGSDAQKFQTCINIKGKCYHIHKAPHPTPRNNNDDNIKAFLNCRHFSAVNAILKASGEREINWFEEPPRHIARLI